jgi:hypothetical protein
MPFLEFKSNVNHRARWTMIVPDDWIDSTDLVANIYWSPSDTDTGDVFWFAEFKSVAVGGSVAAANVTDTYLQAGAGTTNELQETAQNLLISGSSMAANDLLQVVIGRSGRATPDNFTGSAQVHHVVVQYQSKKLL